MEKQRDRVVREQKTLCYGQSEEEKKLHAERLESVGEAVKDAEWCISLFTFLTVLASSGLKQNDGFLRNKFVKVAAQIGKSEIPKVFWEEALTIVPTLEYDMTQVKDTAQKETAAAGTAGQKKRKAAAGAEEEEAEGAEGCSECVTPWTRNKASKVAPAAPPAPIPPAKPAVAKAKPAAKPPARRGGGAVRGGARGGSKVRK